MAKDLRTIVFDNLNNALDNGYSFDGWTDLDIAVDLTCYASDCEDHEPEALLRHVAEWRLKAD